MLRDPNLVPLSHQHQHALALTVRITRALHDESVDLGPWQEEIVQHWNAEIGRHFTAEEEILFPAAVEAGMGPLVGELLAQHSLLTARVLQARRKEMSRDDLSRFAAELSEHIRIEERQLFETCQERFTPEQLRDIGTRLQQALGGTSCVLPGTNG